MKPMTEQEARAALKAEMPWARRIFTRMKDSAWVSAGRTGVAVIAYAPTLRAAVAKAIRAWRNTQRRVPTQKKGAKR